MSFFNIFSKKPVDPKEKLKIIIDTREKNSLIPSELSTLGFQIEFKHLPVADYLVKDIAIERKTISDFKSSIINKRIFTQLLELKQYPKHLLILEGFSENVYGPGLHENAFRGFLLSVALEYKIPIIFTQNEKDTAKYLYVLSSKKEKTNHPIRASKIFKSKSQQVQHILEGFPNLGPVKIKSLIAKFKSLKNIINAKESDLHPILGSRTPDFIKLINHKFKSI